MMACGSQGDDALVVEPFYTNYSAFATMAGLQLVPLTSRGEDGFHLPAREQWEKALTPRTRMVVLCNPNNPTGTVYTPEELAMVAGFCKDRGLFLISDEVYREFVYDGRTSKSALALPGMAEHVIVVDSLSKRYSACGVRLGCLVTRNAEVHQAAMKMAQGRLSAPGLAQIIAVGARELGPDYTRGIVVEYQKRRDILFEGLSAIPGVFLRKPEGAFYFVARLPVRDSEDFASWLLTDYQKDGATVMVAPAPGFYATPGLGADEVRIAYVLKAADLRASVAILAAALPAYAKARGLEPAARTGARAETVARLPPARRELTAGRGRHSTNARPHPRQRRRHRARGRARPRLYTLVGPRRPEREQGRLEGRAARGPVADRGTARGRAAAPGHADRVAARCGGPAPRHQPAHPRPAPQSRGRPRQGPRPRGPRAAGAEAPPPHARDEGIGGSAPQGQETRFGGQEAAERASATRTRLFPESGSPSRTARRCSARGRR